MTTAAYNQSTFNRSSLSSQLTDSTTATHSTRRMPRPSPVRFGDDDDDDDVATMYTTSNSNTSSTSLSRSLYTKVIRRAWKRITRATRRPERASRLLPDGFVIIANNRRRSILFV